MKKACYHDIQDKLKAMLKVFILRLASLASWFVFIDGCLYYGLLSDDFATPLEAFTISISSVIGYLFAIMAEDADYRRKHMSE